MFCHRCGTQVASGNQFCTNCGQALGAAPGLAATPAVAWNPPRGIHSNTWHWIGQGWDLVKADIGIYILLALVFFLLNSAVPLILTGPLMAGFHIVCMKKLANKRAEFADLIAGFNFFIPALVASLVISVFIFAGMLACLIPGLVVAAMYKFTYLFIVDKRMDFWQAIRSSTFARPSMTARTTMWIRMRSAFASLDAWPCARVWSRLGLRCWNLFCAWRFKHRRPLPVW